MRGKKRPIPTDIVLVRLILMAYNLKSRGKLINITRRVGVNYSISQEHFNRVLETKLSELLAPGNDRG